MLNIQSNEAKTNFSKVLRQVEEGQEFAITRHNKVIAILSPYSASPSDPQEAVNAMKKLKCLDMTSAEADVYRTSGRR